MEINEPEFPVIWGAELITTLVQFITQYTMLSIIAHIRGKRKVDYAKIARVINAFKYPMLILQAITMAQSTYDVKRQLLAVVSQIAIVICILLTYSVTGDWADEDTIQNKLNKVNYIHGFWFVMSFLSFASTLNIMVKDYFLPMIRITQKLNRKVRSV